MKWRLSPNNYLSNKERGHKGELTLEPEDAYGPAVLSPEKSMDTVSLDDFPADYPIEVGLCLWRQ